MPHPLFGVSPLQPPLFQFHRDRLEIPLKRKFFGVRKRLKCNKAMKGNPSHLHVSNQLCEQDQADDGDQYRKQSFSHESTCNQILPV